MGNKSPQKQGAKKAGKSLKEKRAEKRHKEEDKKGFPTK